MLFQPMRISQNGFFFPGPKIRVIRATSKKHETINILFTYYFHFIFSNILLRLVECPGQAMAPYFPVTVKSTREVAGFNALAEALLRLDFIHAVSDVRRYIIIYFDFYPQLYIPSTINIDYTY